MQADGVVSVTTRRRRRTALVLLLLLLLTTLAVAGWSALQAFRGAEHLKAAADRLEQLSTDLTDDTDLLGDLGAASVNTKKARQRFEDPFLRLAQELPVVGKALRTAAILSISADTAVRQAAVPLAEAAGDEPVDRIVGDGGSVNVPYLTSLAGPASVAASTLTSAEEALKQAPRTSGVQRLDDARRQLASKLAELRQAVHGLQITTAIAPELLGRDRPRTYFVGVQNPAEARGTGGIVGGYVILEADNGIVRVTSSGANTALQSFMQGTSVATYGPEYEDHWGPFAPTVAFVNSNVSPHFPYAAQTWAGLWAQQSGKRVDGVIALDPIALSYLLRATGPITLSDGSRASASNVVQLTLKDVYAQFDTANAERKEFLQEVTRGVASRISAGEIDASLLLRSLTQAAREGRALLWVPDPRVQAILGDSPVTGRLPARRHAVGVVINNAAGGKLDYYLERSLIYKPSCAGTSLLRLSLKNDAPRSGLPEYVSPSQLRQGYPANTNISVVTLYLPPESVVRGLTVAGRPQARREGEELGLRWVSTVVAVQAGQTVELVASFQETTPAPAMPGRVKQPLVRAERFTMVPCTSSP